MNKLIFRKLSFDISAFFLLSSLAITSIVWVIQGVNLLDLVTERGHALNVYFFYTTLNIPKIFSKLLVFTYFLTLFVIISKYEDNNEILVFWTNGIKKISFINYIGIFSLFFVFIQLLLNLYIVPLTQNKAQQYLKNSSLDFFPKLINEKKFSNVMENLTIFVEEHKNNGDLYGIYIKEKLENGGYKIIISNKGKLVKDDGGGSFKLLDGKITNIGKTGSYNIGFKETIYNLSNLNSKTRKSNKLNETDSSFLISCMEKYLEFRKNDKTRCGNENDFVLKDIYEEIFKRVIIPIYIIVLSLISSLIILKSKVNYLQNYFKTILFLTGFIIIILSELSYKLINKIFIVEILSLSLPLICILFFYIFIFIKSKFKLNYL
tara:strand:+ start:855 stop:1985 length:1131 start_codon:yes stop_codon:yes gene_type:complete